MVKHLPLPHNRVAQVDDEDYPQVCSYTWVVNGHGYVVSFPEGNDRGRILSLHRFLLYPDPGQHVDHINGDKLDNTRANLRLVSARTNIWNKPPTTRQSSAYKGVHWHAPQGRYVARITVNGKRRYLGYFTDPTFAAQVYDAAVARWRDDHAYRNFPTLNPAAVHFLEKRLNAPKSAQEARRRSAADRQLAYPIEKRPSPYRGVYWFQGQWRAKIGSQGKEHHLGFFLDEVDAARAYDAAAKHYHGTRAKLNFPDSDDLKVHAT